MSTEHRAGCEFRVAGRTLSGVAMRYGDTSPDFRERFVPGAFGPVGSRTMPINLQHDSAIIVAERGLINDTARALEVRAELPAGSAALSLVKRGALNGFSIEFNAKSERREAGVRVIERASLTGIALVDHGAYPQAKAEVRARGDRGGRLATLRGYMPARKRLACRCSPGDCTTALFEDGALDGVVDPARQRDVLAVVGDYSQAVASAKRGGLRFWKTERGVEYAIDIPKTARGEALMESLETVPVIARPVLDADASDVEVAGELATYKRAEVRALTIGATDAADGWPELRRKRGDDDDVPAAPKRRRARVWL